MKNWVPIVVACDINLQYSIFKLRFVTRKLHIFFHLDLMHEKFKLLKNYVKYLKAAWALQFSPPYVEFCYENKA